jgi:hypothetical protein
VTPIRLTEKNRSMIEQQPCHPLLEPLGFKLRWNGWKSLDSDGGICIILRVREIHRHSAAGSR